MTTMLLACGFAWCQGADGTRDPIEARLAPPEVLMRFHETLRITPEQDRFIKEQLGAIGPDMERIKRRMDRAGAELRDVLGAEMVDEDLARAKLAEMLEAEREGKLAQLGMLVRINNRLGPDQRRTCRALCKELGQSAGAPEQREQVQRHFREKIEAMKRLAQERFGQSGPPPELTAQMEQIQQLVRQGNLPQAEAALDGLIGRIKEGPPPTKRPE
jgi:Spy/CpxP family protein refolding chaperone